MTPGQPGIALSKAGRELLVIGFTIVLTAASGWRWLPSKTRKESGLFFLSGVNPSLKSQDRDLYLQGSLGDGSVIYMRKKAAKNDFLLLISVSAILLSGFVILSSSKLLALNGVRVLGDSSQSGDGQPEVSQSDIQMRSPEPTDKPEATDKPEPSDTPEPKKLEVQVESEKGKEKIQVQQGDNSFQYQKDGSQMQVQTNFPLSVDPKTNSLTVTTPQGVKSVVILPDVAIQNMISAGIISTQSAVVLGTDATGSAVYNVDGTKEKRLLGIFNVNIDKTAQVSAQNGQVISVSQDFLSKLLDLLSF